MINFFSNAIIPIIILIIIIYGVKKKVNIYDVFIEGAKESIELAINLFPSMLAMILGVNIFLKSGIIDAFFDKSNFANDDYAPNFWIISLSHFNKYFSGSWTRFIFGGLGLNFARLNRYDFLYFNNLFWNDRC